MQSWTLRALGLVAWLMPWRIEGELPDVPKLVMIAAPHSSNFDGVYGLCAACAIGFEPAWMGKHTLFQTPLAPLLFRLGGIPTDRGQAHGVVRQMADEFARRERMWLVLAPEGTRKPVPRWRSGFYRIALAAGVPIFPVAFDYPRRRVVLLPLFEPTGDYAADLARLQALYLPFEGRHGKRVRPEVAAVMDLPESRQAGD